ncbi:MAG: hypothetical protein H6713_28115 [Myxococcales bacterium]|nr:hypothetical protein [Myxococcales bacterium]
MASEDICVACGDLPGLSESQWSSYSSSDFEKNFKEPVIKWLVDGISNLVTATPWIEVYNQVVVDLANETIKLDFGPTLVAAGHFKSLRELDSRYRASVAQYTMWRAKLAELSRPLSLTNPIHVEYACHFNHAKESLRLIDQDKFNLHRALYELDNRS